MDFKNISLRKLLEYFLKEKDQDTWREFDRRIRPTIRGAAARQLRSCGINFANELVEEVTQEVCVKLVKNDYRLLRKDWPDDDSIFRYVKVVGSSAAIDWWRKNKILPVGLDDSLEVPTRPKPNPAESKILREQVDRCLQALASHPNFTRDRDIFWLFYHYGYHDSEIARLVNLPVKTVQNILQKYVRVVKLRLRKDKDSGKGAPGE